MSVDYERVLDSARGVVLSVRFDTARRTVVDYAIVLSFESGGRRQTVRVYDSAHEFNELHRHSRTGGKQSGEAFHDGSLGEGMRSAIMDCVNGYERMIEGWDR